jgi:hypothetical protein
MLFLHGWVLPVGQQLRELFVGLRQLHLDGLFDVHDQLLREQFLSVLFLLPQLRCLQRHSLQLPSLRPGILLPEHEQFSAQLSDLHQLH